MPGAAHAVNLPPKSLRELAAHATQRQIWPQLRNYAKTQTDPEWSGWAYFLAGYQEFQAQVYHQAAEDLAEAARNEFALADYAVFYQASSLRQDNRPQDAAARLQDFASHFPHSRLLVQVLAMRASALLSAGQAQATVDALLAEPATHKLPALALLLGQAYMQAQHPGEAAATFQNVYYNFPLSSEAKAAADALSSLRNQMGTAYPQPEGEWKIARVETLFKAGRYADALDEYSDLLKSEPSSPLAPRWQSLRHA
jgi:predicted Zn-dependent protease